MWRRSLIPAKLRNSHKRKNSFWLRLLWNLILTNLVFAKMSTFKVTLEYNNWYINIDEVTLQIKLQKITSSFNFYHCKTYFHSSLVQGPIIFNIRTGIMKDLFIKLFVALSSKKEKKYLGNNDVFSYIKTIHITRS